MAFLDTFKGQLSYMRLNGLPKSDLLSRKGTIEFLLDHTNFDYVIRFSECKVYLCTELSGDISSTILYDFSEMINK